MINDKDLAVIEVVKRIISDFGADVLCDKKRAVALVADYFSNNGLTEEKMLLKRVLTSDAVSCIINSEEDYLSGKRKAIYVLTEQEFIAKDWAERALSWFDVAFGHTDMGDSEEIDLLQQLVNASREAEQEKSKDTSCDFLSPIDMLLDENNTENIVLYGENDEEIEFEQIALIPLQQKTYAILKPVLNMPGVAADEALVFVIDEVDDEDCLVIVEDDSIVDVVFEEYYKMLRAEGIDVD